MKTSITKNKKIVKYLFKKIAVIIFWVLIWYIIYLVVNKDILVASPMQVFNKLIELFSLSSFWISTIYSMLRVLIGFLLGVIIGLILAFITCSIPIANELFEPIIEIIKATPVASFIILALVWLKTGEVPSFISFLMVLPIVWGNVSQGIRKTDTRYLDIAKVFEFNIIKKIIKIYLPSAMPYFVAACTTSMGFAWKSGIAAEIIGNTKLSIGGYIYNSKIYIETDSLFAFTLVVIILSIALEKLMYFLMKVFIKKYNIIK